MSVLLLILYQPYKWLIVAPIFLVVTILGALFTVLLSIISHRIAFHAGKIWAKITQWIIPMRVKITGRENIQKNQSYVIMANHQSSFDIIAIYANIGIPFRWIMKEELRKAPLIGWACEKGRHIFIARSSARASYRSLQKAKEILVGGISVVIFPEGTRNYSNALTRFKSGGFKLAQQLELPILPVSIKDTHKIMGKSVHSLFPGKIEMTIHAPIDTLTFKDEQDKLMEEVRTSIGSALPNE